ncbi:MAG: glycosyltransferase family 9 protein, partial [Candidatus Zixiibacteriota bacterium]
FLLSENPYLNELIVWDKSRYNNPFYSTKKIFELRRKSFDTVIDFFSNPRSAWTCFFSGARYRIGYDFKRRGILYNVKIKSDSTPTYAAQSRLDALKVLGIENSDIKLDFFLSQKAKGFANRFFEEKNIRPKDFIISVSPTSRRHFNRWSLDNYSQLCDWLIGQYNAKIILVWGPGEKGIVEKLSSLMKKEPIVSAHTPTLQELGAILKRCDMHIGNDNGTKHIAVAEGLPTLTIFGPHSEISWTFPDPVRHKWVKAKVDCPECEKIKHSCKELKCLDEINVVDVKEKLLELMKGLKSLKEKAEIAKTLRVATD